MFVSGMYDCFPHHLPDLLHGGSALFTHQCNMGSHIGMEVVEEEGPEILIFLKAWFITPLEVSVPLVPVIFMGRLQSPLLDADVAEGG